MVEPLDPKKYHILTPGQHRLVFLGMSFVAVVVLPVFFYLYYRVAVYRPSQTEKEISMRIEKGDGLEEIAQRLYDNGAVNSKFLFLAYAVLNRHDSIIQAGSYKIPAGTSVVDLVRILQHGTDDVTITFPEGIRAEEFARLASGKLSKIDYYHFLGMIRSEEGYLFPDTYSVSAEISEEQLAQLLTTTFSQKTEQVLTAEALTRSGMTKEQVVVLASIVEREVANDVDRPIISGILEKRWRRGELLGADATTQYAVAFHRSCPSDARVVCPFSVVSTINWWPSDLTVQELASESPYNTRKIAGLPPGPICSPGLSAIKSVINAVPTDYNYYLTGLDGKTYYAVTLVEHNKNISMYLTAPSR